MNANPRTPAKTELKWLFAVVLGSAALGAGGALYVIWRVLSDGASC